MCYSAVIYQDYRYFVKRFGAVIDIHEFVRIFWTRQADSKIKIPKAMELAFNAPLDSGEVEIKAMIDQYAAAQSTELEQELFKQAKRLADAERTLATRTTKSALESRRIASEKIDRIKGWLGDLRRTEPLERDSRIYPQHYAPVMVMEGGQYVVKPMRYGCRPAGKPAFYDVKFPGCYNARKDNLEGSGSSSSVERTESRSRVPSTRT